MSYLLHRSPVGIKFVNINFKDNTKSVITVNCSSLKNLLDVQYFLVNKICRGICMLIKQIV